MARVTVSDFPRNGRLVVVARGRALQQSSCPAGASHEAMVATSPPWSGLALLVTGLVLGLVTGLVLESTCPSTRFATEGGAVAMLDINGWIP
jgi:hypothetical protein